MLLNTYKNYQITGTVFIRHRIEKIIKFLFLLKQLLFTTSVTIFLLLLVKGEDYYKFLKIWGSLERLSSSDDDDDRDTHKCVPYVYRDDDKDGNLGVRDNGATAAAVAVGVVGAVALGATLWNHFSNRNS